MRQHEVDKNLLFAIEDRADHRPGLPLKCPGFLAVMRILPMLELLHYESGIYAFDAGYIRPQLAAIHLIVENGQVALPSLPGTGFEAKANLHAVLRALC